MQPGEGTMWHVWLLLAGCLPILGFQSSINLKYSRVMEVEGREESVLLIWGYDPDNEEIALEIQVPKASWIGLGLSYEKSLNGSDVVIGGWNEEGETFFYDTHVETSWPPIKDDSQDYELLELKQNDTHSCLKVWRKWHTCDPNDLDIGMDTVQVIAVFGDDSTLQYSEDHYFMRAIFFMEKNPEIQYPTKILTYDFKLNDYVIPDQDTTYACTFIPTPRVSTKHHIIKYEAHISPESAHIVHHILIYACDNTTSIATEVNDCYGSDSRYSQCLTILFGWAVGGEDFFFPEAAGVSLGTEYDPQYVRFEIHYSNFNNIPGIVDNSGIRIIYTPELRQYDSGILMLGVFTFPIQFIPPGVKNFHNYGLCNTELIPQVLDEPLGDLTASAYLLHAHLTARGVRVLHYRNGTLIGTLGEDNHYDFGFQQIRYFPKTITMKVGDQIVVECTANTMDREEVTYGGPSTLNEMCIGFVFYYPRIPLAACWSFIDLYHVIDALSLDPVDSVMDAIIAMSSVEWDNEKAEIAQRAVLETNHTVIVQNLKGTRVNETSQLPPIFPPVPYSCDNDLPP